MKAIAIYRDGSKQSQPLSTKSEGQKAADKEELARTVQRPRRERLPDTRHSVTHKFNVNGHEGYINVGLYPDGRPGEVFITMAKEGSTVGGLMDSFGTAISISLQYGVPLEVLVHKFSHTRFEPMGHTTNPEIKVAKSVVDYIFRWLGNTFLRGATSGGQSAGTSSISSVAVDGNGAEVADYTQARFQAPANLASENSVPMVSLTSAEPRTKPEKLTGINSLASTTPSNGQVVNRDQQFAGFQSDAPPCDNCGSITVRNGNCYLCHNCGNSLGCS